MSEMEKASPGVTALEWIVEALSDTKEVDIGLLEDFLVKAPLQYDSLPIDAKERISLRRLEHMFSTATIASSTSLPSSSDGFPLDASEPAQDVYNRLLPKMEMQNLKSEILHTYAVSISDFIREKRSRLPQCTLQQLEESVIEGGDPSSTFLRGVMGPQKRIADFITDDISLQPPKETSTHVISAKVDKVLRASTKPLDFGRKRERKVGFVDGGGDNEHVVSKKVKIVDGGQMDSGKPQHFRNNARMSQKKQQEGSQGKNTNKAKSDCEDKIEPSSCGSKEHKNIGLAFDFNLETTVSEGSLDANLTEKKACIVCNGGRPLMCCVNTCQVAVCESCLGFSPVFDSTGNFYCPRCSYLQARSTCREITAIYCEIQEKLIKAKETAKLAKERWKKFCKLSHGSKGKQAHELPSLEEVNQSEMVGDELSAKGKQNDIADNEVTYSGPCQREAEHSPICSKILRGCPSQISDKDLASITKESSESPSMDDQQHADLGTEDRGMCKKSVSSSIGPSPRFDGNDNEVAVNADKQQMDVSSPGRNSIPSENEVFEYDSGDGCYDLRRRQIPVERSKQLPSFRRKNIPWAPEEKEKLKEGVEKYEHAWKSILEFGQGVFQESRTAIDLKDKWRNMNPKGISKEKRKFTNKR